MNSWFKPLKTDSRKRSLMALLGGVAAIGIAKSVSAQTSAVPLGPSVGNVSGGGGGGGSGATRVASIAALQALASSNGTALLTQANLFGTFNWNSANLSTQVTNDPGQGIYVAWSGDSAPGASGAWVRQYSGAVALAWWGVVADGATDNSTALQNWNTWARTQLAVSVICPPGQINYDMFHCFGTLYGLPLLDLYGYGTTFQNTSATGGSQWPFFYAANPNLHTGGFLIATTAVGAVSVTCLTPAQAGNFVVGSAAVVMSLDLEYLGYPPCPDQFDYVIVTAVNTSTGVVTFANDVIRYVHRADFADGGNSPGCGKARIWLLDSALSGASIPWNVHHTYCGITINQCSVAGGATYAQQCGRSIKLIDCKCPGVSPTQTNYVGFERCEFTAQCEIDKLNNVIEFIGCDRSWNVINNIQTSSVNLVKVKSCNFTEFQAGNAKHTIIDSCNIEAFNDGGYQFGCPRDVVIINSIIQSYPTPPMLSTLTNYNLTVDGVNSIYANGVFTILNGGAFPNSPFLWNTIIGNEIVLGQTSVGHPGDKGVGFVTAIADVGSGATAALQITTTLPYANLAAASWASGAVYIKRRGRVFVYGSSGCDVINNLNDATLKGFQAGEFWRALLFGVTATTMNPPFLGELIELDVNVIQATAISGAALIMNSFGALTIPALTGGVTYTIQIDLTTAGQRTFTLAALTGKVGSDGVSLNSAAQTALPAVWCPVNSPLGMRINYAPTTPNLLPVVEVIMKFSTGITGKLVPLLETAGIVGQIP